MTPSRRQSRALGSSVDPLQVVLLVHLLLFSCTDGSEIPTREPSGPPGPSVGPPPSVLATVSLSDAPLEGELVLTPVEGETAWSFAVDLDNDGAFDDAQGQATAERRVPYRFTDVGVHRIRVRFERSPARIDLERLVAVNDPDAFVLEGRTLIPPNDDAVFIEVGFEGISVNRNGDRLYLAANNTREVFGFRSHDLSLLERTSLRETDLGPLEGLALSPDQSRLFVGAKRFGSIAVLSAPDLEILGEIEIPVAAPFFVESAVGGDVLVSGREAIARVDVAAERVIAERSITEAWHLDLAPDGDTVALVSRIVPGGDDPGSSRVYLLDSPTLEIVWSTELPRPAELTSVAFHPSGDRIYAFGHDGEAFWLFVVEAGEGHLRTEIRIEEPRRFPRVPGVANPAVTTPDGRFVIFSTENGGYFVDTALDVPRFRVGPEPAGVGCCNVAAANTGSIWFMTFGELFRGRLAE